ncbi:MAG: OB-fold domain-containing protein [Burkholderiales bacterium]|nr:OB-fold domain-containing protein [Burkholderiales bacterium]
MNKHAAHFWEGCAAGELRYQHCAACAALQFHARAFCLRCGGAKLEWRTAQGSGTVYALSSVARAPTDEFRALAPYVIVLVDLDEGLRMMAHGAPGLCIGDRVRAGFFVHGGRSLPRFDKS